MNYNDLKSIVASSKQTFAMTAPAKSFYVVSKHPRTYIEPSFTKQDFGQEKPRFLLITAIGASGKSALAKKLSSDTGLPLLDLGVHPPVADNTLTGLLTTSFALERLSDILTSLKAGSFGIIVDGIDEGRSKVNEAAFNAFVDDLIKLSAGSERTSFVLLGRTQALIDCWVYLAEKGISVGLASIDPFSHAQAIHYIDTFAQPPASGQRTHYEGTRDSLLKRLETSFSGQSPSYWSFIGYPPVLDAVATLLREERNYFKLSEDLKQGGDGNVEAGLLYHIASYILDRERKEKVIPNLVKGLVGEFPPSEQKEIESVAFSPIEQAARLIAHVLKMQWSMDVIPQPGLNAKYEEQIGNFLNEHPFLASDSGFRNAIFEAACLAILISAAEPRFAGLVETYFTKYRNTLYLIQMLNQIAPECLVDKQILHVLIGAALEFRSVESNAEITIEPTVGSDHSHELEFDISIEVISNSSDEPEKKFHFRSRILETDNILLGSRLSSCFIEMPCEVTLSGADELEFTAPVELRSRRINLAGVALVVKGQPKAAEKSVILEAAEVVSALTSLPVESGIEFVVTVIDSSGHHYPLVKYIKKGEVLSSEDGVREKYLKLRKILTHFRSHSKGTMAKLRAKVDHERVAGNDVGRPVLDRLLRDGILVPDGVFYFLQPDNVDKFLGVSWTRLREGDVSEKLVEYLRSIE